MSDIYKRTSTEELTAMADGIREIGTFAEEQTFVFPSTEEVTKKGFDYGCEKAIEEFWDNVASGDLTQENVNGIIYSEPLKLFYMPGESAMFYTTFPNIKKLSISASLINSASENFGRLNSIEEFDITIPIKQFFVYDTSDPEDKKWVEITEIEAASYTNQIKVFDLPDEGTNNTVYILLNNGRVGSWCFENCYKLKNLKDYRPTGTGQRAFTNCTSLEEITFARQCPHGISEGSFWNCTSLQRIYLPDVPPSLGADAFEDVPNTAIFYVSSSDVKNLYIGSSNWQPYSSQIQVVTAS